MPAELVWSNRACADLLEIYVMIGLGSPRLPGANPGESQSRSNWHVTDRLQGQAAVKSVATTRALGLIGFRSSLTLYFVV